MPFVPIATKLLVITGGPMTLITKVLVPVPLALAAESVTLNVPETVGVPLIKPVVALTLKPDGNPLAP